MSYVFRMDVIISNMSVTLVATHLMMRFMLAQHCAQKCFAVMTHVAAQRQAFTAAAADLKQPNFPP